MTIEEEIFRKSKIDVNKIIEYGFKKEKNIYKFSKNIMDDTFRIDIEVDDKGTVKGKIFDLAFEDEYTSFRIEESRGAFVGQIKDEFESLLKEIRNKCFRRESFIFEQSNRITNLIKETYGDEPDFKWEKSPDYAVFVNSNNGKWYGIIMNIDKSKIEPNSSGEVEIIDIKLEPTKIEKLLEKDGFYPAWHMNKKSWITIILDNTISDKDIMKLIEESYLYTVKR